MSGKWACLFLQTNRFIKRGVTVVRPPSPGRQINGGRTLGPVGRRADGSSIQPALASARPPRRPSFVFVSDRLLPQEATDGLGGVFFQRL